MVRDNDDVDTLLYASLLQTVIYDPHQIVSVFQCLVDLVSEYVCVCVCVCERERERLSVCMCMSVCVCVCVC